MRALRADNWLPRLADMRGDQAAALRKLQGLDLLPGASGHR